MDPINSSTPNTTPLPAQSGGFPKNTILLIVLLLVVTGALVYFAWPKTPTTITTTTTTPTAIPTPKPIVESVLTLNPNPVTIVSSASASISVDINTGSNAVTGVQIELTYDPTKIGSVDIKIPTTNPFFTSVGPNLKKVDATKGTVSYLLGISPSAKGVKGMGTVATITFRPLVKTGTTQIMLSPTTQVTAEGQAVSVLKSATGTTINF